jgi:hypothetical protein
VLTLAHYDSIGSQLALGIGNAAPYAKMRGKGSGAAPFGDWASFLFDTDIQSNNLDNDYSKLMTPGAFGLGSNSGAVPSGNNANNAIVPGFYGITSTSTNNPSGGTAALIVHRSYNVVIQVAYASGSQWVRRSSDSGGTWTSWDLVAENNWGSNGNGYWTRLADGTQYCWRSRVSVSINNTSSVVWTGSFPASFHSGVTLTASGGGGNSQDNDYGAYALTTRVTGGSPEVRLRHLRDNSRTDTLYFDYLAMGRWKA